MLNRYLKRGAVVLMSLAIVLSFFSHMATAAGGQWQWSPLPEVRVPGSPMPWYSIASSDDGTVIVAGTLYGFLYTSTDSGATWTEHTTLGNKGWTAAASSADGAKLVAADWGRYIYTSTDSGATWTERSSAGSRLWRSVASSANGTKLAATNSSGFIYTSADSGVTWTERNSLGSQQWRSIISSADGTKLVAATQGGSIYTSVDSGTTWTAQSALGHSIQAMAGSSDGTKLVAATLDIGTDTSSIYTSTDSGVTWVESFTHENYATILVTSSADGTKLTAAVDGNSIFTGVNSGTTWTKQTVPVIPSWWLIASSADGVKLAAMASNSIYTSTDSGTTWTWRLTATEAVRSLASSADGTKLMFVTDTTVYSSTDSGAAWSEYTVPTDHSWSTIASSGDGVRLVLGGSDDDGEYVIYTSTDSGATWHQQSGFENYEWISIASSADGTKLAAVVRNVNTYETSIVTSGNAGTTWTEQDAAIRESSNPWQAITISADGATVMATDETGYIFTSTDFGITWGEGVDAVGQGFRGITSLADGRGALIVAQDGSIYKGSLTEDAITTTIVPLSTIPENNKATTSIDTSIANASLSVASPNCHELSASSITTLGSNKIIEPAGVDILGGVSFSVNCTENGGETTVTLTLASQFATQNLRVYKTTSNGVNAVDITNQVTIANQHNKTIISYTLVDGGALDEDGSANGIIVDPIFIGVLANSASAQTDTLAATGSSLLSVMIFGSFLAVGAVGLIAWSFRIKR